MEAGDPPVHRTDGPGTEFGSLGWSRRRSDAAGRATSPARTRQL